MEIPENKKVKLTEVLQSETKKIKEMKEKNSSKNSSADEVNIISDEKETKKKFQLPLWADMILNILILIAFLAFIRAFIFLPFNVDGPSMEPTLHNKEFIYVDRLMPSFFGYDYGDVIVFYPPAQHGKIKKAKESGVMCALDIVKNYVFFQGKENPCNVRASYVKRIIALPGDAVEVKNGSVWVTKKGETTAHKVSEDFLLDSNKKKTSVPASIRKFQLISEHGKDFGIVPEGKYFVLGDNRKNSSDSRAESWDIPFVSHEDITGIVRAVYLSPKPIPPQETYLSTFWESIKSIPSSLSGMRGIGDENIFYPQ